MYSTCLFCHTALGANQVIEHFPVGRRLAFDASRGRLWVVCRKCQRWNLTPLEERWEAIEECERLFSETRLRVSTDNIGLAKLLEGLELVRIGSALRPEMAAWRYGDQFGRRRMRHLAMTGAGIAVVGGIVIGGPLTGVIASGGWGLWQALSWGYQTVQRERPRLKLVLPDGQPVVLKKPHLDHTGLVKDGDSWRLELSCLPGRLPPGRTYAWRTLRGPEALRVAGQVLPHINNAGASRSQVLDAVRLLERQPDPMSFFRDEARKEEPAGGVRKRKAGAAYIARFPLEARLALEMAAHEEQERRAMEGELALLEEAWRQAEEIAKIADDMFLPSGVAERLEQLRSGG